MVLRQKEIQQRKDLILAITIDHYIESVTPVSSKYIAGRYPEELSTATIRNVLAELEQEGFLTHPHTSAGRIPTQMGYRYYVDHLMKEIKLLEDEKGRIKEEYKKQSLELDALLEKTSQVISDVTQYTSIISVDGWGNKLICHGTNYVVNYPDYQDVQKIKRILTALDEKERLLKVINQDLQKRVDILIGQEISCEEIEDCSLVISQYQTKEGTGRMAVLGPTRMDYNRVVSALEYFSQLMKEIG